MKIVMLGHSGVGKTTFMACMYAMLQRDIGGFSVQAADVSTHERLLAIAIAVLEGRYPDATTHKSSYDLILFYKEEAFFGFEWIDYRGNALNESGSHSDMQELQQSLEHADGIIAFFDGVALAKGGRPAREAVGRLMVLLQQAINSDDRLIPTALVITKVDLLEEPDKAIEPVLPLGKAIAQSKTVHGALIFTGCGEGFAFNVEKPTLFVLHKGIIGALMNMRAELQAKQEKARDYADRATAWDWITSKWEGLPTFGEMAEREMATVNAMIERHNELVDPANALKDTLTDIEMF